MCKEKPDIVTIQETKKETIDRKMVGSIWSFRFREWAFLPSEGRSGGILVMWDSRTVRGVEVLLGAYSVSVKLSAVSGGNEWWFSGIYGPCRSRERKEFWEELAGLYGLCAECWCVGGDFNVDRFPSEKLNGGRITWSMRNFDTFIT